MQEKNSQINTKKTPMKVKLDWLIVFRFDIKIHTYISTERTRRYLSFDMIIVGFNSKTNQNIFT